MSLTDWEAAHAQRFGDEIALVADGMTWTNRELSLSARRFAQALLDAHVAPGDRVVIALPNCVELFTAHTGATIAGAVVVILGDVGAEELAQKIAHCEPAAVVFSAMSGADCRSWEGVRLRISVGAESTGAKSFERLLRGKTPIAAAVPRSAADIAQLCYTSGSTGRPKAVAYTHGGIDAFWRARVAAIAEPELLTIVLVAFPPTAFGARFIGMRHIANYRFVLLRSFDAGAAFEAIERHGVHELPLVPTMAEMLATSALSRTYDCSSLRSISISGAHVPASLIDRLRDRLSSPRIFVLYGMTETGGGFAGTDAGGDGRVGHIVPGTQVRIVDRDGRDVRGGASGEIIARTPYAGSGYWRDPEASAAVFRDGFVRTGDLGRFTDDGQLCVLGRLGSLIIQGGLNIHPSELNNVIHALDGVRECEIVGVPDQLMGEVAIACVVCDERSHLTEEGIRAQCQRLLDPRKAPAHVCFFSELPKTRGGKVDVQELRREVMRRAEALRKVVRRMSGRDILDLILCELRHAMRIGGPGDQDPCVDPQTTFGELGVRSLDAVRLARALREHFAFEIPSTLVYSHPTLVQAAAWLEAEQGGARQAIPGVTDGANVIQGQATAAGIVGIGCRLPGGADSPASFWDLMWSEKEAVCAAPAGRGVSSARPWRASFVERAGDFDARFFRYSADVSSLDPRIRMLLETCWQALEDAGCDPAALAGGRTGLFLGISGDRHRSTNPLDSSPGMAAGHVCQFFDFRGPVLSIDTTCSSSLVAFHYAVRSLRDRDCDVALVGGVSFLPALPDGDPLGVIARDGRTKAFGADADGFGQGEGCVVIVLKRLDDAQADGDRIYAAVLGTAINHDGRSSSLAAPNPRAQAEVIRLALQGAAVDSESIQYIEAHGTGTSLGDPLEAEGIAQGLGERRRKPVLIGSVKSNIGHLEAAAGAAGVCKLALGIARRLLPASLNCSTPNPHIPWDRIPVQVQRRSGEWPRPDEPLLAGVSSFGMSGTNAHAILGEPPVEEPSRWTKSDAASCSEGRWLLPISAKSWPALRAMASRWVQMLEAVDERFGCRDIAYTASCRRSHFEHRLAVSGSSRQEWADGLRRYLGEGQGVLTGRASGDRSSVALVFSGQGSQWCGMGRELFAREPVFRRAIERCAELIDSRVSWKLIEEMNRDEGESKLGRTEIAQPALFAMQVALYELWRAWGIEPTAAVGHSAGEIASAFVAGILTLEEAVDLACERGRILQQLDGEGLMVAAAMSSADAAELCRQFDQDVEIAAINGPRSVVLSGAPGRIRRAVAVLRAGGVRAQVLPARIPFHTRSLAAAGAQLASCFPARPARPARLRLVSSLTGSDAPILDAAYWQRQLREPVQFHRSIQFLLNEGCTTFIEVSPHPVLLPVLAETIAEHGSAERVCAIASLRRGVGERDALIESMAHLYCSGVPIEWRRRYDIRGRVASLPHYAWEHASYLHDEPRQAEASAPPITSREPAQYLRSLLSRLASVGERSFRFEDTLEALGFDSLAMIRLRSSLEREAGVKVPADAITPDTRGQDLLRLFNGRPTPCAAIASPLQWLRREGSDPTYILVHPIGGGAECYRALARSLSSKCIVLEAPALRSECSPLTSIEAMASDYLARLAAEGLAGPFVLGGWSFGGAVAYEMAAQLRRAGTPVLQVVLIDSYISQAAAETVAGVLAPVSGDTDVGRTSAIDLLFRRLLTLRADVPLHALVDEVCDDELFRDVPRQRTMQMLRVFQANCTALLQYRPSLYDGPVLSVRAAPVVGDPDRAWGECASGLAVHRIEADHYSIMSARKSEEIAHVLRSRIVAPIL